MATAGNVLNILECAVCLETFTRPRTLPCVHTFCLGCVEPLAIEGSIKCPECRASHIIPAGGVVDFPPNPMAIALLDSMCKSCHKALPQADCAHCGLPLCTFCLSKHAVRQALDDLQQSVEAATKSVNKLDEHQMPIFKDIDMLASSLHQKVDSEIQSLRERVKSMMAEKVDSTWDRFVEYYAKITVANSYYQMASETVGQPFSGEESHAAFRDVIRTSESMKKDLETYIGEMATIPVSDLSLIYDVEELPTIKYCVRIDTKSEYIRLCDSTFLLM